MALALATAASAAPLSPCTLQVVHSDGSVSSRQVAVGQCVRISVFTDITQIVVGNGTGHGSLTAYQFPNCTGNVVRQGPSPVFFNPPATVGAVRIDSCP
ncbi:hypothetical protein ADL22_00020 [Streptomyces sp. NRRL F-4489]|nr:hypothetical protein ADL22_00020 [Streptomyces sp. NRRL F-4489]